MWGREEPVKDGLHPGPDARGQGDPGLGPGRMSFWAVTTARPPPSYMHPQADFSMS